jgi:hypothetical protein
MSGLTTQSGVGATAPGSASGGEMKIKMKMQGRAVSEDQ